MKTVCIAHNIRSVHNIGSIFRTADSSGVQTLYLTGYSPTPHDRFGNIRSDIKKVALGAEEKVSWNYEKDPLPLVRRLKREGFLICAIEQHPSSLPYTKLKEFSNKDIAFILGNEVDGIEDSIIKEVDMVFEIPMSGDKESLNVSVVAGIIFFRRRDA